MMKQWTRFFFLLPLLFAGAFSAFLFARPKLIVAVGNVFLWAAFALFVVIILYVVGTLSYLRITHRKPASMGITVSYAGGFSEPAFVGTAGHNAPFAIREDTEGINVSDSWWTITLTIIVTALFGPGALLVYFYSPRTFGPTPPLVFVIIVVLIVTCCCVSFVVTLRKYLFYRPRLAITGPAIRCFKGNTEVRTLWKQQIAHVASRSYAYALPHQGTVPNYILYARLQDGDDVPLCVTDKKKQISLLEESLAQKGYKVEAQESS
jgi:hypothetical protein